MVILEIRIQGAKFPIDFPIHRLLIPITLFYSAVDKFANANETEQYRN